MTHESEQLNRSLEQAHAQLEKTQAELGQVRDELAGVYASRPWRTGMMVADAVRPARRLERQVRRLIRPRKWMPTREEGSPRVHGAASPSSAYAASVEPGQVWHFPRDSAVQPAARATSPLHVILDQLGASHESMDPSRAAAVAVAVERSRWTDDEALAARQPPREERQAIVEADAIVSFVRNRHDNTSSGARRRVSSTRRAVVVDARCLQDPNYRTRGVGRHAQSVLQATRMAASGHDLVLMTSAELPALDGEIVERAEIVTTPYSVRADDVHLFVELSPMTAPCTAALPFLAQPGCAAASVMYDFIPEQFPVAYLDSPSSALSNRARIEALRHYDLLFSISRATAATCVRTLGSCPPISVTGVGDPLCGVLPTPSKRDRPYMLVPAGGDARKNLPAAVAALAEYRRASWASLPGRTSNTGDNLLRAVIAGSLVPEQEAALTDLAEHLGLPEDAVEFRGYVSDGDFARLYRSADLTFVASLAEGFSIPVAEAVLRGTPVVASDIPVHRELIGAGPWLASATDVAALAHAIDHVRAHRADVEGKQRAMLGATADPARVEDQITTAVEALLARSPSVNGGVSPRRARPRLAVISPFPPQKSGVADYTAYTFGQVARYADVEVYTSASAGNSSPLPTHGLSSAPYLDRHFDAVVNIVGNSHFHFPVLDLMGSYGGAAVSHDNRMVEAYVADRGETWTAGLLSRSHQTVQPDELRWDVVDLDRLPTIGYDLIARQASPLIVHGRGLANRVERETGVRPEVVPFVPYNVPDLDMIDDRAREHCRSALGLADESLHIATFGMVHARTKGTDLIIRALSLLRGRGRAAHLHIVGELPPQESAPLASLSSELGVAPYVTLHGRVDVSGLKEFLLAVDVAVQLRMSAVLSLSGAVADCIAFGVPTVTTQDVAEEMDAPGYVTTTSSATSALLIANAIDELCEQRRENGAGIEAQRREYLDDRSVDAYARGLLAAIGLWT